MTPSLDDARAFRRRAVGAIRRGSEFAHGWEAGALDLPLGFAEPWKTTPDFRRGYFAGLRARAEALGPPEPPAARPMGSARASSDRWAVRHRKSREWQLVVRGKNWFDARRDAAAAFGCEPGELVVIPHEELTELRRKWSTLALGIVGAPMALVALFGYYALKKSGRL